LQPNRGCSIGNRCSCSRFNSLGDVYTPALRAMSTTGCAYATSSIPRFPYPAIMSCDPPRKKPKFADALCNTLSDADFYSSFVMPTSRLFVFCVKYEN
ncbi:MAG: hypothetical protein ACYT04_75965, partial [Nostoc sp.]